MPTEYDKPTELQKVFRQARLVDREEATAIIRRYAQSGLLPDVPANRESACLADLKKLAAQPIREGTRKGERLATASAQGPRVNGHGFQMADDADEPQALPVAKTLDENAIWDKWRSPKSSTVQDTDD